MVLLQASKANHTTVTPPRITNYSRPSRPRVDTPLFTLVPVLQASLHKSGITSLQRDTIPTSPSQQTAITIMFIPMSFPKVTLRRLLDLPLFLATTVHTTYIPSFRSHSPGSFPSIKRDFDTINRQLSVTCYTKSLVVNLFLYMSVSVFHRTFIIYFLCCSGFLLVTLSHFPSGV